MTVSKCRILCVDDHLDTSEMLSLLMAQEDFEVVTAHNFEEAISLSLKESFDLYVLDKRLPDGSGIELCQRLQLMTPGVASIFYTGDAYEVHRLQAIQAGADAYVAKPNIDELIATVHRLLNDTACAEECENQ